MKKGKEVITVQQPSNTGAIISPIMPLIEKRAIPLKLKGVSIETRSASGRDEEVLTGRAAVFEEFTELHDRWGDTFYEKFDQNSMDKTLADGHKIMILYNHSWDCLLGSTASNLTLTLKKDGLYFEYTPKNFDFDRRIVDFVRDGTIVGCSIGYFVTDYYWEEKEGEYFRIIKEIELLEMTLTPIPAYEQTSVDIEVRKVSTAVANKSDAGDIENRNKIASDAEELLKKLNNGGK